MAICVPNIEEQFILELQVNKAGTGTDLVAILFTNNVTLAGSLVLGGLTEASGSGYAAKTLTGTSWVITNGAPTSADYAQQEWTFTGALGNVYGYALKRGTALVKVEKFDDGPYNITASGHKIQITPKITNGSTAND